MKSNPLTWTPELSEESGPIYLAVADALARDLQNGLLRPGDQLPTQRDLARHLGVNAMTISRAYAEAGRRGLTEGEVGRGTFVKRQERNTTRLEPQGLSADPMIDFHFNLPWGDPSLLDASEILRELAEGDPATWLHTGYHAAGTARHRESGAAWLARSGVEADAERILVCGGAQHAMTITLASLTTPGDLVLTEELTYPGMKALASVLGVRLLGLPMDSQGLLPEALDHACRQRNPKALYCMPTIQNPTGRVQGEARRREMAEVARRHGLTIVEDDTYTFLLEDPPTPIASIAPERTWFLTGTSKSLTAGLRIGYLLAPQVENLDALLARVEGHVAALTWMAAPLMAEVASRWIRSGAAETMVAWKRREARERRRLFERYLPEIPTESSPASPHVWLPLPRPWRSEDFVALAGRRGIALTGAEAFVAGRASAPHAVRVSLGTPPQREQVENGLRGLAEILSGSVEIPRALV